jgi:hypothetical protein
MMRSINISVNDGISHRTVLVLVIDLGTKRPLFALFGTSTHVLEPSQVLLDGSISVLRGNDCSSLLLDLYCQRWQMIITYSLSIGIIHESITLLDELLGVLLDLLKVIRGVNDLVEFNLNHTQVLLDTLLKKLLLSSAVSLVQYAFEKRTSSFNGLVSSNRKMN